MGCANGFSSLVIAEQLEGWNGTLVTGDISEPSFLEAKKNAEIFGSKNIDFRFGNILETVSLADGPFDFIFIDAQKSHTHLFFDFAKQLLSSQGIIVIDDTQKFAHKMHTFHSHFQKEKDEWYYSIIPETDDAMMIFMKKSDF